MAEKSLGVELKNNTDGVAIGSLTSIGEIGLESEDIDTTTLDAADGVKSSIPGLKDGGEIPFEGIVSDDEAMSLMYGWQNAGASKSWLVTWVLGANWTIPGYLKTFKEGESNLNTARTFKGVIKVTGKPVFDSDISV